MTSGPAVETKASAPAFAPRPARNTRSALPGAASKSAKLPRPASRRFAAPFDENGTGGRRGRTAMTSARSAQPGTGRLGECECRRSCRSGIDLGQTMTPAPATQDRDRESGTGPLDGCCPNQQGMFHFPYPPTRGGGFCRRRPGRAIVEEREAPSARPPAQPGAARPTRILAGCRAFCVYSGQTMPLALGAGLATGFGRPRTSRTSDQTRQGFHPPPPRVCFAGLVFCCMRISDLRFNRIPSAYRF